MGTLKPLLPYGPGSVIQAVVRSLRASPVDRVLVVLGHRSEELAAHLHATGAETVLNPRYPEGMLTSVQAGLTAASPETEWAVIALGDQPALQPSTVRLLLERARTTPERPGIVVPSYGMRRGHPLLIHRRYFDEALALPPEVGLRELLRRHPDDLLHVDVPSEIVLTDMDTPQDYQRELHRLSDLPPAGD
ncbi:MAG: NTP transferase domain-containing protein [Armatimonadota bacterium]